MKKFFFSLFILSAHYLSYSQGDESYAYGLYRLYATIPPYGLQKIQVLISKLKDDEYYNVALDRKTYLSLSLPEKFTYNIIHPESFNQNCSIMPAIRDEQKKIFAQLPNVFVEYAWSERQRKFFIANRDAVIRLMRSCILKENRVGLNFKHVIVDINAKEMIPLIKSIYNATKKDHDLLTVLMLLMQDNKNALFLASAPYRKLYADGDASYSSYLNFSTKNEALIIKQATIFYNGLHE